MKKLLLILSIFAISLNSCTTATIGPIGPIGLPGPAGPPGQDGGIVYAQAFEIITNFNADNDFQVVEGWGFEFFPADVPLIYILWESDEGTEIWRPMPQLAYFENGILSYNFDFTQEDFSIFLDGTVPSFEDLDNAYLNDQVFRIVVVPSEFMETARLSSKSYDSITSTFGIDEGDFVKKDLR